MQNQNKRNDSNNSWALDKFGTEINFFFFQLLNTKNSDWVQDTFMKITSAIHLEYENELFSISSYYGLKIRHEELAINKY